MTFVPADPPHSHLPRSQPLSLESEHKDAHAHEDHARGDEDEDEDQHAPVPTRTVGATRARVQLPLHRGRLHLLRPPRRDSRVPLVALAALTALQSDGWDPWSIGYGTFISGMVTATMLSLFDTVRELDATRQELARSAVERERLRFSRDRPQLPVRRHRQDRHPQPDGSGQDGAPERLAVGAAGSGPLA